MKKGKILSNENIIFTGHHSEYISSLIDYLFENKCYNECYFLIHPDFPQKFPFIVEKANDLFQ
jgi:hypothetical protein